MSKKETIIKFSPFIKVIHDPMNGKVYEVPVSSLPILSETPVYETPGYVREINTDFYENRYVSNYSVASYVITLFVSSVCNISGALNAAVAADDIDFVARSLALLMTQRLKLIVRHDNWLYVYNGKIYTQCLDNGRIYRSGTFTIDTIAPQIAISNPSNLLNSLYYNGSTEYSITVTERNFSQELIIANIKNEFTNAVPTISFTSNGNSTHTAKVSFPEGDYSFSLSGTDLGGHKASIFYNGTEVNDYFFTSFNVDATKPKIQTNFKSFGSDENEAV